MSLQYSELGSGAYPLPPLTLVEEITHRVLNEYTEAIASLALAAASSSDARSQVALTSAAIRLRSHAEAHRALRSPVGVGPMDLSDYIVRVCACLTKAQLALAGVRLTVSADEICVESTRCWRVGLIVAELIRNAARHGLAGGPGAVRVEITQESGYVYCQVCDNGSRPMTHGGGRGRGLVQALAGELGGAVEWIFGPTGCNAELSFPLAAPPALFASTACSEA